MRDTIRSIEGEFQRYKKIGEGAIGQLDEPDFVGTLTGNSNSVAVLVWHVSGNLSSRFTDFLTTDGEKPWRDRESEFTARQVTRVELMEKWDAGWKTLLDTLQSLADEDLGATVAIRGRSLTVREALHRSLAHICSHVGQIVFLAKALCGPRWKYLSIPPGQSDAYNKNPAFEKPPKA